MSDDAPAEMADLTVTRELDEFGLSAMERAFCEAALDLIASGEQHWRRRAAETAGYKEPRGSASVLIRRPRVIAYMTAHLTEAAETIKVDRSFVLFRAVANMAACEGKGDFRTAARYLDVVAKHVDVGAFTREAATDGNTGHLSLPFDPKALSAEELSTMIALMRKASGGQPSR